MRTRFRQIWRKVSLCPHRPHARGVRTFTKFGKNLRRPETRGILLSPKLGRSNLQRQQSLALLVALDRPAVDFAEFGKNLWQPTSALVNLPHGGADTDFAGDFALAKFGKVKTLSRPNLGTSHSWSQGLFTKFGEKSVGPDWATTTESCPSAKPKDPPPECRYRPGREPTSGVSISLGIGGGAEAVRAAGGAGLTRACSRYRHKHFHPARHCGACRTPPPAGGAARPPMVSVEAVPITPRRGGAEARGEFDDGTDRG